MYYEVRKVTITDCLSVATKAEKDRLDNILDFNLMKTLVKRWCVANGYKLGGYLGHDKWDATSLTKEKEVNLKTKPDEVIHLEGKAKDVFPLLKMICQSRFQKIEDYKKAMGKIG